MRRIEIVIAVAGLALAGIVLAGAFAAPSQPADPPRAAAALPRPAPAADTVVEVVVPAPPPPVVADLPGAVADVLAEQGHTDLLPQSALMEELPPNVVGVLMEHDAVLRIPQTEATLP